MRFHLLGCFVFSAAAAFAQIQAPVLGYLPDSGRLLPIQGIPSAGAVGWPLRADRDYALVVSLPGQNAALAVEKESGDTFVLNPLDGIGLSAARIEGGALPASGRIEVSPSGTAAILADPATGHIRVVASLPGAPAVMREISAAFAGEYPVATAVSDDGQWVAGIWPAGIYAFGPDQQILLLPAPADVSTLAFLPRSHGLALAGAGGIWQIADIGASAAATLLYAPPAEAAPTADAPSSVEIPAAIAATLDSRRLVVIFASGRIWNINLATRDFNAAACECAPAGLYPLDGPLFRVTVLAGGSIKVYDALEDRVWFVPLSLPLSFKYKFSKSGSAATGVSERPQKVENGAVPGVEP